MHLISILALISSLIITTNTQYPVTYGCVAQIFAYAPMPKLYTFVTNLNAATTNTSKKSVAKTWVVQANMGTHLFPALDIYSKPATALTAVNNLIDHRTKVGVFWVQLLSGLTKVYNATVAKQYKNMWVMTDKTYDNSFYDALNEWYAYCHYHSPSVKRTALYNAIQAVTTKYVNDTQLNFVLPGDTYDTSFFLIMLLGMW